MSLSPIKKLRLLAAWAVGVYLAEMYIRNGWIKFYPHGFWTPAFERWGFPVWFRWLIGAAEVAGGVMLLAPWVNAYGAILLVAVMFGAFVIRLGGGWFTDAAWIAGWAITLGWIAVEWWPLRRPRWTRATGWLWQSPQSLEPKP